MSSSNCWFLTCIQVSQEAGQVVWYSHLFQNFPQFIVIHIVKGFGIVNKADRKYPKCLTVGKRRKKLWYIYTMEYYSAFKRRKFFHTEQLNLEDIIVKKMKRANHIRINTTWFQILGRVRFSEAESGMVSCQGKGWGDGKQLFNRHKASLVQDESVLASCSTIEGL